MAIAPRTATPRSTSVPLGSVTVALLAASLLGGTTGHAVAQSPAQPEIVYQSMALERLTGEPTVYQATFQTCDPAGSFRIVLDNGPDGVRRVSTGSVWLNGALVISQDDFNQQVAQVARSVTLAPTNALEVRLDGGPGGMARITVDGYMQCLRVRITAPLGGSIVREHAILVEGELDARHGAAVQLAVTVPVGTASLEMFVPLEVHGRRFAARVPVAPGVVSLRAVASDDTGRSAEDAVTVTVEPDPDVDPADRPDVSPTIGFAPLQVTFGSRAGDFPEVVSLELDVDGDGRADFALADFAGPSRSVTYTYQSEGLYVATFVVRDQTGWTLTSRVPINVIPVPDLAAAWTDFVTALGRDDVEGALRLIALEARERYRRVLEELRPDLATIAATLQGGTALVIKPEYATFAVTCVRDGQSEGFIVSFVRDTDGVWRITSL